MAKYRKKPIVIEAVQFNPTTESIGKMFMEWPVKTDTRGIHLTIPTLEGDHRADPGDWIIRGIKGEFYPCKNDVFIATYEPAE